MKIVVFGRSVPTERYPTYGIFEWDQAMALKMAGHEVVYAYGDYRSIVRYRPWGNKITEKEGIKVYSLSFPLEQVFKPFKRFVAKWLTARLLNKITSHEGSIDVWISHFTEASDYVVDYLASKNQVHVVMEHSSRINAEVIDPWVYQIAHHVYTKCSGVVAVSNTLANKITKDFGVKVDVIPNIVNTSFKYPGPKAVEPFTFVVCGNLIASKRHKQLIDAFSKINDNCRLWIIGDGPLRIGLESLVKELSLNNRVKFFGLVKRDAINELYQQCNCLVLPSSSETFGVVYIEAMAAGMPVIATRCGGPEDFVNPNNGLLVDIDDHQGLVDAMQQMMNTYREYDHEAISRWCKQQYSSERIGQLWSNYLVRLENNKTQ